MADPIGLHVFGVSLRALKAAGVPLCTSNRLSNLFADRARDSCRYTRSPKSGTMCRIGDLVLARWVAKLASAVQPTRGSDPRLMSKLGDCV